MNFNNFFNSFGSKCDSRSQNSETSSILDAIQNSRFPNDALIDLEENNDAKMTRFTPDKVEEVTSGFPGDLFLPHINSEVTSFTEFDNNINLGPTDRESRPNCNFHATDTTSGVIFDDHSINESNRSAEILIRCTNADTLCDYSDDDNNDISGRIESGKKRSMFASKCVADSNQARIRDNIQNSTQYKHIFDNGIAFDDPKAPGQKFDTEFGSNFSGHSNATQNCTGRSSSASSTDIGEFQSNSPPKAPVIAAATEAPCGMPFCNLSEREMPNQSFGSKIAANAKGADNNAAINGAINSIGSLQTTDSSSNSITYDTQANFLALYINFDPFQAGQYSSCCRKDRHKCSNLN